jgi:hypothetical protein
MRPIGAASSAYPKSRTIAGICCSLPESMPTSSVARSLKRKEAKHAVDILLDAVGIVSRVRTDLHVLDDRLAQEDAAAFWHHRQTVLQKPTQRNAIDQRA